MNDLRFAVRALLRTPFYTIVAVASLALGLALTAATVAVMNAYAIASLPYPEADRLYRVRYAPPGPWEPRGLSTFDWTSVADVVEFPKQRERELAIRSRWVRHRVPSVACFSRKAASLLARGWPVACSAPSRPRECSRASCMRCGRSMSRHLLRPPRSWPQWDCWRRGGPHELHPHGIPRSP